MASIQIHRFSQSELVSNIQNADTSYFGERGAFLIKMAQLNLPIAPGFLIDSKSFKELNSADLKSAIQEGVSFIEKHSNKTCSAFEKLPPLTLKVCLSPAIHLDSFRNIHNVGLNKRSVEALASITGAEFAYTEYKYLLSSLATNFENVTLDDIALATKNKTTIQEKCESLLSLLNPEFSEDILFQIEQIILKYKDFYFQDQLNHDIPCALFVQMMAYGNLGEESYNGDFYTRNIVTGDKKLQGFYGKDEMFTDSKSGLNIQQFPEKYLSELSRMAEIVENDALDIKYIRFTVEHGKLWLVSVFKAEGKTTKADLSLLLDLYKQNTIDAKYLISHVNPNQLKDLLHRTLNVASKKQIKSIKCGIAGSPGACVGKVFFNTKKLVDAYQDACVTGEDSRFILIMPSTYAGDVQAIEIGQGVISSEGGYASHAPVVARSLGKPALVIPDLTFNEDSITIEGNTVKEGDYISFEVIHGHNPAVYLGKVELDPPNLEDSNLYTFIDIVKEHTNQFYVRANADTPKDARMAKKLGALGIGLCRTEHMFFNIDRIQIFREMLLLDEANSEGNLNNIINSLKEFQISDFEDIFKEMQGMPVTIRLLDAPLHEFIPHSAEDRNIFFDAYKKRGGKLTKTQVGTKFDRLKESNPMLGHRGSRYAISFFSVYKMQVEAILEAAYKCHKNNIEVFPEIMLPVIMSENEITHLIYGKDIQEDMVIGINGVRNEFLKQNKLDNMPFSCKLGSMIELPAAALQADKLAAHVEFFSYGTNDLTQTTHGLSRDDINSFLPSYTKFDILTDNPFQILTEPVKMLIEYSSKKSRMFRPDIKLGLCGEHGSDENNIVFCIENGLNYVSCSPYGVPIALLSIARYFCEVD